jgi:hypothetical protein
VKDLLLQLLGSLDLGTLLKTGIGTALVWLAKVIVTVVRRRNVADAVFHAFHVSETLADDLTDGGPADKALDTVTAALDVADQWMLSHGWRVLKPYEKERATLMLQSLNGQTLMKERLAYASAAIVKAPLSSSPN